MTSSGTTKPGFAHARPRFRLALYPKLQLSVLQFLGSGAEPRMLNNGFGIKATFGSAKDYQLL
jgi:hypothetical protein